MYLYRIFHLLAAFCWVTSVLSRPLVPRAPLLDTCVSLEGDITLTVNVPVIGLVSLGSLNICLCVSALPLWVETSIRGKALIVLFGSKAAVVAKLTALLNALGRHCTYPLHADPICSPNDPCNFDCNDGYVRQGTQCVCPPPRVDCNGKCRNKNFVCGSAPVKRAGLLWKDETCPVNWSICGEYSRGHLSPSCVDTQNEVTSCGGCTTTLADNHKRGVDCTTQISGALDVSCVQGSCRVDRCQQGSKPSADRSSCVSESSALVINPRNTQEANSTDSIPPTASSPSIPKLVARADAIAVGAINFASVSSFAGHGLVLDSNTIAALAASTKPLDILLDAYSHSHAHSGRDVGQTPA